MNALVQIQAAVEAVKAAGAYPVAVDVKHGQLVTMLSNGDEFTIIPSVSPDWTWENICTKEDVLNGVRMTIRFQGLEAVGTVGMLESMPKIAEDSPRDYPNRTEMKRRAAEGMEVLMKDLLKVEERGLA